MQTEPLSIIIGLGIPGLSLYLLYALSRRLDFSFAKIGPRLSGALALCCIIGTFATVMLSISLYQPVSAAPASPEYPAVALFGNDAKGAPRVESVPRSENFQRMLAEMRKSQRLRCCAFNGSTWLQADLAQGIEEFTKRKNTQLDVLLADFTDSRLIELAARVGRDSGDAPWDTDRLRECATRYAHILTTGTNTIGFYGSYSWTRFTIFDDRCVSFILAPTIVSNAAIQPFFSTDPSVIACFRHLFDTMQASADTGAHLFHSQPEFLDFCRN